MCFKLSNLNSNLAPTLGYINPALNNLAQGEKGFLWVLFSSFIALMCICYLFVFLSIYIFTHSLIHFLMYNIPYDIHIPN